MREKICFKCGRKKPLNDFYKHPKMADGHLNKCKSCTKADVSEYRESKPGNCLETRLKACKKNPTKINARRAVEAAMHAGALVNPGVCFGCGCKPPEHRIEAHHHDYSKPLDIVWLCTPCHREMDKRSRAHEQESVGEDQ